MISSEKESSLDVFSKILSDPKSYDDLMNGKDKIELRRNYWVNLVSGQIVTFEPAFSKGVFLINVQLNGSKGCGTTYFLDEIINEVTNSFKRDLLKGKVPFIFSERFSEEVRVNFISSNLTELIYNDKSKEESIKSALEDLVERFGPDSIFAKVQLEENFN
jgi:hypothetical protein